QFGHVVGVFGALEDECLVTLASVVVVLVIDEDLPVDAATGCQLHQVPVAIVAAAAANERVTAVGGRDDACEVCPRVGPGPHDGTARVDLCGPGAHRVAVHARQHEPSAGGCGERRDL